MPCAPRPSKKAQRIVDDILGPPPNAKRRRKKKRAQERVEQSDTLLSR